MKYTPLFLIVYGIHMRNFLEEKTFLAFSIKHLLSLEEIPVQSPFDISVSLPWNSNNMQNRRFFISAISFYDV